MGVRRHRPHVAADRCGQSGSRTDGGAVQRDGGSGEGVAKADGYSAPSLLAPENAPPETSGTAFYTDGLAWGINNGLLSRTEYEPTVRKGWAALQKAIQPDGRLGWVQKVGDSPDQVATIWARRTHCGIW
ncbi:glycoside hydrolase family 88 protein [Sphingobium sp.]|uniref:glycoside hydrolase family 88 protein n=1 Tax=Sphingobium sp. TaxID=1912891 RepID=UPI003B3B5067